MELLEIDQSISDGQGAANRQDIKGKEGARRPDFTPVLIVVQDGS